MKKTDLAYIAGLFDGEGCIAINSCLKVDRNKRMYSLACSLSIANEYMPQLLKTHFGGRVRKRDLSPPRVTQWDWRIHSINAIEFLKSIYPYMVIKKPQADIAFKFQSAKLERMGRRLTEGERATEEVEFVLMRKLKHTV